MSTHALQAQACLCTLASGGSDAPDLNPVLLNVVINGVGIAGTSWLFQRDLRARQRDRSSVEREEALARLQVGYPSMYAFPSLAILLPCPVHLLLSRYILPFPCLVMLLYAPWCMTLQIVVPVLSLLCEDVTRAQY